MENLTSALGSGLINISSLCAFSEDKIHIDQITAQTIEAYMNNVVNTVHDFVNRAFILISIALGSLIALMLYMIIVFSNRTRATNQPSAYDNFDVMKEKDTDDKISKKENNDLVTANNDHSYKTASVANIVTIDERILDEMGFSFQTKNQSSGIHSEEVSISNFSSISLCSEEP